MSSKSLFTRIDERPLSQHAFIVKQDVYGVNDSIGKPLDTVIQLQGQVTIEGSKIYEFRDALEELISKYKI